MQWSAMFSTSDSSAARSWEIILAIANWLMQNSRRGPSPSVWEEALFLGYLARITGSPTWGGASLERAETAIRTATPLTECSLFGGLCGLGWTIDYLPGLLTWVLPSDPEAEEAASQEHSDLDVNADIDSLLLQHLQRNHWKGPYDLINGLVGFGTYFLGRLGRPKPVMGLELVIYQLDKVAESSAGMTTWHTRPEVMPHWQVAQYRDGRYNSGVAHGVAGVLYLLNEAIAAGVEVARASRLLQGGVAWLLERQGLRDYAVGSSSCARLGITDEPSPGWCEGDLGILSVLRQITRRTDREDWGQFCQALSDACLARIGLNRSVKDSSLCHGCAGIAHICNRIYQESGDPRFLEVARQKYGEILGNRFRTHHPNCLPLTRVRPRLLDGDIGVGLALLSSVSSISPDWDRLLLISGYESAILSSTTVCC